MDGALSPFIMIGAMFVLFYFLLIRPQQKRQKEVREMQAELQKGDRIVTIGGFHGLIHAFDDDTVVLETEGGTKVTYDRMAIREVKKENA